MSAPARQIIAAPQWACGHPRTLANTQSVGKAGVRCKQCREQINRRYRERKGIVPRSARQPRVFAAPSRPVPISAEPIVRAVAAVCGVRFEDVISSCRKRELAEARFAAMLVLHNRGWSYPRIAAAVGRQDHTTCIHGVARAKLLVASDPGFAVAVSTVAQQAEQVTQ